MKYFFRLLLLIGLVFGLIALIGSLLPRTYSLTAAMDFNAPQQRVYDKFHRLPEWKSWSNWSPEKIDGLKVDYLGESGPGSAMTWSEARGEGKLWITKVKAPEWIEYKMTFANFPESTGRIEFLTQTDGMAFVEWQMQGELPPGPFYGFWASNFAKHMEHEYQLSLEKLKKIVEQEASETNQSSNAEPETAEPKTAPTDAKTSDTESIEKESTEPEETEKEAPQAKVTDSDKDSSANRMPQSLRFFCES